MHNKYFPITVFLCLFISSLLAGHYSFREAQREISNDLTQALYHTYKENQNSMISQDTIRAYKQIQTFTDGMSFLAITDKRFIDYLKYEQLRKGAYVSFGLFNQSAKNWHFSENEILSDTLIISDAKLGETIVLKGVSKPTLATILSISNQCPSLTLAVLSLVWALFSWMSFRKKREGNEDLSCFGGVRFSEVDETFYGMNGEPIHFTPMQTQLMRLFWEHPSHSIPKDEICAVLWPKKEDANDTLYTLVKRIKPILEDNTNLRLTADRGKSYVLKNK